MEIHPALAILVVLALLAWAITMTVLYSKEYDSNNRNVNEHQLQKQAIESELAAAVEDTESVQRELETTNGRYAVLDSQHNKLTDEVHRERDAVDQTRREMVAGLRMHGGDFSIEVPEQQSVIRFVNRDARVLEIGGNIGRVSLVLSSILSDSKNLVVVESDPANARVLEQNRDENGFSFKVVNAAISNIPLAQYMWNCYPVDEAPEGSVPVPTVRYQEMLAQTGIDHFDTLVADCEGCMDPILQDSPEIFHGVTTFIVENDYLSKESKARVDQFLSVNGFKRVFAQALDPGLGSMPCDREFYEVYRKF